MSCLCFCLLLAGCSAGGGYNARPWEKNGAQQTAAQTPDDFSAYRVPPAEEQPGPSPEEAAAAMQSAEDIQNNGLAPVKVAILLPLSGEHARLGQSMMDAAQMALFDLGYNNFELLPKDTKGTADGARAAAREAVQDGAGLVLGPLFSHSVRAARQVTQSANINMIAFSTDWTLANQRTFLIGFLPFDQVERIVSYAAANGYTRIGTLSPSDNYGNAVAAAFQAISGRAGISAQRMERFSPQGTDLSVTVRRFADYDQRKAMKNEFGPPFDAVLMPVGSTMARTVGSFLSQYDLPPSTVKRLGTGLMDEESLASDPSLQGAWFAAPSPKARRNFENRYKASFHTAPPRVASLAYDATALAAILARTGLERTGRPAFDRAAITNPNGFAGVDGIFRFRPDGIVERGLAVLEFKNGRIVVLDEAPRTFQRF